jgi:transketolase
VSVKWPLPFEYPADHRVEVGTGWTVREGSDAVMFAYGPWLLSNAVLAADDIAQSTGMSIQVVNLPWLNRVNAAWLSRTIGAGRTVIALDNHYLHGGQGDMLAAATARLALTPAVRVVQIGVAELPECGTNDEVLAYHGLDVPGLVKQLRAALEAKQPGTVAQLA